VVGIGPIPSVRLCWRSEQAQPAPVIQTVPSIPVPAPLATSAPASPPSPFAASSFFERREAKPASIVQPVSATIQTAPVIEQTVVAKAEPVTEAAVSNDPLARFKKMPDLMRLKR
jgi:hypothetical protein